MGQLIYKIMDQALWQQFQTDRVSAGSAVDLRDGFIHFSTGDQVAETARRHFSGQTDLILVAVAVEPLGAALRWEPSRQQDLFPHLYRPLHWDDRVWHAALPLTADGHHDFSGLIV